jgi:phosphoribosyl 1,2-cyclic phosphodiesterase
MRFCSLGSGSAGNATLIEARSGGTTSRVLVDCGFSLRELQMRLARIGLACDDIDAVFITHEHGDHIGCAVTLARRHEVPLLMSRGTWRAIGQPELPEPLLRIARDAQAIAVGGLQLMPFTVTHDAEEPLQLRVSDGAHHLGVLTDTGSITPHLLASLRGCDALLLECNHDRGLLANSSYPASLKARIGGRLGHLANDVSAQILSACLHDGLKHLVAAHLSERNNTPALARAALASIYGGTGDEIVVADPTTGFGWLGLGSNRA